METDIGRVDESIEERLANVMSGLLKNEESQL